MQPREASAHLPGLVLLPHVPAVEHACGTETGVVYYYNYPLA